MKRLSWKLGRISLSFTACYFAFAGLVQAASWPLKNPNRDSIFTTYGEYQHSLSDPWFYLHTGIDIGCPAETLAVAADSGWIRFWKMDPPTDSAMFNIGIGFVPRVGCEGWVYTHVDYLYSRDSLGLEPPPPPNPVPFIRRDSLISRIYPYPSRGSANREDHLHFERVFGQSDSTGPGNPVLWKGAPLPFKNPLHYLPSPSRNQRPQFQNAYNPIRMLHDSTGVKARKKDTLYVVSGKMDVVGDSIWDWCGGDRTVAVDSIVYLIRGKGSQEAKGFSFRGATILVGNNPDTAKARLVAQRVYADTGASKNIQGYSYIVSNTANGVTTQFTNPDSFVGYWNTKQHRNRAWNEAGSATQDSAKFPDGFYWVVVSAWDTDRDTAALDSIRVIVNNFPPLVDSTAPKLGQTGVPRSCTLKVWFDQPMDTASVKLGFHLRLKRSGTDVSGRGWFGAGNDTVLYFKPDSLLLDTVYVMKDSTTTKDAADSAMATNYEVWFDTYWTELHVSFANSDSALTRIEVWDPLFQTRQQVYAEYGIYPPTALSGQVITFDREGNRYVCEAQYAGSGNEVEKYDTSGSLIWTALPTGSYCRSITGEGDTLFAVGPADSSGYNYRNWVISLNLNGDSLSAWGRQDSVCFEDAVYSPAVDCLFLLGWGFKNVGSSSTRKVRNLGIYRYTKSGQFEVVQYLPFRPDSFQYAFRLTAGKDRLYLARNYGWSIFDPLRSDTVVMYNWNLSQLGRFASSDGMSSSSSRRVLSLIVDQKRLYTLIMTRDSGGYRQYWVRTFTPGGDTSLGISYLTKAPRDNFAAIAVFPSILGERRTPVIRPNPPLDPWAKLESAPLRVRLAWKPPVIIGLPGSLAGFHVYRAGDEPLPVYTRITSSLVLDTVYTDYSIAGGRAYRYFVTAVDTIGNESDSSRSVGVGAPPSARDPLATAYNNAPKILRDRQRVLHVAYTDSGGCFYVTSSDSGQIWSSPLLLGPGRYPGLALDGRDSLFAVWTKPPGPAPDTEAQILYSRRHGDGTWDAPVPLARYTMPGADLYGLSPAALVVQNDTARVVYECYNGTRIVLGPMYNWFYSIFHGTFSISAPQSVRWQLLDSLHAVVPPHILGITSPSVAADFNHLSHVVWHRLGKVCYRVQIGDTLWKPLVDLSQSADWTSWHPSLNLSGNRLGVAWVLESETLFVDVIPPSAICYRTRLLGDTIWSVRETLSVGLQYSTRPVLSEGPSAVFSASPTGGGPSEVYLTHRGSSGWTLPENVSNTIPGSNFPHLFTVQGASERVSDFLWTEGDAAPYEVVYKELSRPIPPRPWFEADVGQANPSSFTIQRDGYLVYGPLPYQTIDYDHQKLIYRFPGLDTLADYRLLLVAYFEKQVQRDKDTDRIASVSPASDLASPVPEGIALESSKPKIEQIVLLNGVEVGRMELVSGVPDTFSLVIPKALYQGGEVRLTLDKKKGRFASLSELYLYRWGAWGKKGAPSQGASQGGEGVTLLPRVYDLSQSYPNPARDGLRINYALPKESHVNLRIYNVAGQLVRTLREGKEKPGYYSASWDGKDQFGHRVSSGVYLYRMEAGEFRKTRKLVVVR